MCSSQYKQRALPTKARKCELPALLSDILLSAHGTGIIRSFLVLTQSNYSDSCGAIAKGMKEDVALATVIRFLYQQGQQAISGFSSAKVSTL